MSKKHHYDPAPFQTLLHRLLDESQESFRAASVAAGLSPNTISNYRSGIRPSRDACITLANHFSINPNEMLEAAGYEPLWVFDEALLDPEQLSPDVRAFATMIQRIKDVETRRRVMNAVTELIQLCLPSTEEPGAQVAGRKASPSLEEAE